LQEVAEVTNTDEEDQECTDKITLMTIHAAKGVEFAYVYVVDMEEELFPSQLMLESQADLGEVRRLFYVAPC
jgi:DNA helicase II / ATP-dependent DNA helicase PcrA